MSTSLSSFVDNLSELIAKSVKTSNLIVSLKDLKITKFLVTVKIVEKKQLKPINRLIEKFPNTYKFFNNNINKFIFLLKKEACPYEYMVFGKDLTNFKIKRLFTVNYIWKILLMKIIYMPKKYLRSLN